MSQAASAFLANVALSDFPASYVHIADGTPVTVLAAAHDPYFSRVELPLKVFLGSTPTDVVPLDSIYPLQANPLTAAPDCIAIDGATTRCCMKIERKQETHEHQGQRSHGSLFSPRRPALPSRPAGFPLLSAAGAAPIGWPACFTSSRRGEDFVERKRSMAEGHAG